MKTNGEISVWKNGYNTITIFNMQLYLVTLTTDMGLLTGIDYYDWLLFMVELKTMPKYKFLTFFSQTSCNYK